MKETLIEKLAVLEHEQWGSIVKHYLKLCPDLLLIPDFERRQKIANTPYQRLSE